MNPLVEALSQGKQRGNDYGADLHTRKDSHLSAAMNDLEWHFSQGDMNLKADVNETYIVCIPVICTSSDDHDVRFRQVAKPYVSDEDVFKSKEPSGTPEKIPMVRLQTENVP